MSASEPTSANLSLEQREETDPVDTDFDVFEGFERDRGELTDPVSRQGDILTATAATTQSEDDEYIAAFALFDVGAYPGMFGSSGGFLTADVISASATDGTSGASPVEADAYSASSVTTATYEADPLAATTGDLHDRYSHDRIGEPLEATPDSLATPTIGSYDIDVYTAQPYDLEEPLDGVQSFTGLTSGMEDRISADRVREFLGTFPPFTSIHDFTVVKGGHEYSYDAIENLIDTFGQSQPDDYPYVDPVGGQIDLSYFGGGVKAESVAPVGAASVLASTTDGTYESAFIDGNPRVVGPTFQSQFRMAQAILSIETFEERTFDIYPLAFAEGEVWAFLIPRGRPEGLWARNGVKYGDSGSWLAQGDPGAGVSL